MPAKGDKHTPAAKLKIGAASKRRWQNYRVREEHRKQQLKLWADPVMRERQSFLASEWYTPERRRQWGAMSLNRKVKDSSNSPRSILAAHFPGPIPQMALEGYTDAIGGVVM